MENVLNKDTGHSLVVMTSESLREAMNDMFVRAKEAAIAEMDARARATQETAQMITKQEAMRMLGKSANTLWKWARRCYLKPVKVGGRVMYRLADIDRILEHQL